MDTGSEAPALHSLGCQANSCSVNGGGSMYSFLAEPYTYDGCVPLMGVVL